MDKVQLRLAEMCSGLIQAQRYDEAVSRAFVVVEERLRDTLGVHGGSGVHLSEKAFAPDSGDLVDRLARPRGEVDGIRNLFVGAFKAYRNRAAHTMADYTLNEARAVIHLANLLLLILKQVERAPSHQIRKDVAELLEPDARRRLSSFLESLQEIGIRKGEGESKTPYKAVLRYRPPSWETPRPYEVSVFYLNATGGKPRIEFRCISLEKVVGLDLDTLEEELLQLGCVRVGLKTVPIWLYLNQHNDQETFDQLYRVLHDLMDRHRV
jgi:uncharacterized protein (TIGR02391 family)